MNLSTANINNKVFISPVTLYRHGQTAFYDGIAEMQGNQYPVRLCSDCRASFEAQATDQVMDHIAASLADKKLALVPGTEVIIDSDGLMRRIGSDGEVHGDECHHYFEVVAERSCWGATMTLCRATSALAVKRLAKSRFAGMKDFMNEMLISLYEIDNPPAPVFDISGLSVTLVETFEI